MTRVLEPLYIFGAPGKVGGAATKIRHLVLLLQETFQITVVLKDAAFLREKEIGRFLRPLGIPFCLLKDLPKKLEGVALAICELDFFSSGTASEIKRRGLKLVFSNEMMWEFKGEAEAARDGVIDRVLFVSDFQAAKFAGLYSGIPSFITGNYVAPEDFPAVERRNPVFTIGRLSRPDPVKYPEDFPVFYEELGLREARYRVMAWDDKLRRKYAWHRFGPEWEFLGAGKERADRFLQSLDLFVYPLGHSVKESWGRSTVEAMLTGCVPLVPAGHQFHNLIVHAESGFICGAFSEYRAWARELFSNGPWRRKLGRQAANHAREKICNREEHRLKWIEALRF